MIITWHGEGAVKLAGKDVVIAINPHDGTMVKMAKFSANIVLLGGKFASLANIKDNPFIIDAPGEHEVGGVFVYGIEANEVADRAVLFVVELEGLKVGFLSGIKKEILTTEQLEFIEGVDVLCVPVGSKDAINSSQAIKLINQIEPRIVIPIDFKSAGSKSSREGVEGFLKAFGAESKYEKVDKLKITKKELPQEDTKVYVLDQI